MPLGSMHSTSLLRLAAAIVLLSGCHKSSVIKAPPDAAGEEVELMGRNLLVNGDAETLYTTGKATEKDTPAIWSRKPDALTVEYGSMSEEWPDAKPGCPDGRKRYFRLALAINEASKEISQSLAVTSAAADIDSGAVECALGGWFGGWVGGDASARLEVNFLGANDAKLGTLATEAPDPAALAKPEAGRANFVKQVAIAPLPAGTRRIETHLVAIRMTKNVDTNAVAAADNLSVVLEKKKP